MAHNKMSTGKGWKQESMRHSMAAKGIKTSMPNPYKPGINVYKGGEKESKILYGRRIKKMLPTFRKIEKRLSNSNQEYVIDAAEYGKPQELRAIKKEAKNRFVKLYADAHLRTHYGLKK